MSPEDQKAFDDLKMVVDELKIKSQDFERRQQNPPQISLDTDIFGLFETVSAVPAGKPKGPYDQVKIYVNGATLRLYWYDGVADVWHYVTATA